MKNESYPMTRSLESHQSQEGLAMIMVMDSAPGLKRFLQKTGLHDLARQMVFRMVVAFSDAAWADELLAGGWQRGLGCNPSRRVDAVSCPSALAEARFQWTTPRGLAGVRESAGEVPVPDRCELGQPGRQEDREHLQHGQSPA